jgi:hypothetical protein
MSVQRAVTGHHRGVTARPWWALLKRARSVAESGPMSPVSRGRKKKRPTTRPRRARRVVPGLAGVHAELLGAFRPVVQATDPLEVEVLASDVLGSWWKRLPPGEDPDAVFGEGAIGHAARAGTREAWPCCGRWRSSGLPLRSVTRPPMRRRRGRPPA